MKYIIRMFILCALILTMTGCASSQDGSNHVNSGNSVDQVISEQIGDAQSGNDKSEAADAKEGSKKTASSSDLEGDIDYDLTTMTSDMVYATVYQLMVNPDDYIGKTFRINGLYSAYYYEPTGIYYHYCIIPDATSCCTQGLEFVWDNGEHVYPNEYPDENASIVIQGTFETYQEDGDNNLYCRLNNAAMKVENN